MMRIRILNIIAVFVSLMLPFTSTRAASSNIGDGLECKMPATTFKYIYLDSLLKESSKPDDEIFLANSSNNMDVVKAQVFLWYVYRNPRLAGKFFQKVSAVTLLGRNEDSISAILWLMSVRGSYYSSVESTRQKSFFDAIKIWKAKISSNNYEKSLILDTFSDDNLSSKKLASLRKDFSNDDPDFLVIEGDIAKDSGDSLASLYYYTKVAEYGYQSGLVGAALLLPTLGGQSCVSRAAYYTLISGATGPVSWIWSRREN